MVNIDKQEWRKLYKNLLIQDNMRVNEVEKVANPLPKEEIEQELIIKAEFSEVITQLKHNKAGGPHNVVNEIIKYRGNRLEKKNSIT